MRSGVYRIQSIIDGKEYIGSTWSFGKRFREHRNLLENNKHGNQHLQNAWNKYGKDNFIFEIIEICDIENLIITEQQYLDSRPNLYNIRLQAESNLGIKRSEETKRKMSLSKMGNKNPNFQKIFSTKEKEEIASKMRGSSNHFFGKHHSEETKQKLKEQRLGKPLAIETRKKMSVSLLGKKRTDEAKRNYSKSKLGGLNPNAKKIKGLNLLTQEVRIYEAISLAKKDGFNPGCVLLCVQGKQRSHRGYSWQYLEDCPGYSFCSQGLELTERGLIDFG